MAMNRQHFFRRVYKDPKTGQYGLEGWGLKAWELDGKQTWRFPYDISQSPDLGLEYVADMEFTGLHDKDGTPVFEGDIVFLNTWESRHKGFGQGLGRDALGIIELVRYENGAWMPFWDHGYIQDEQGDPIVWFKVIGNIYESPGLLAKPVRFIQLSECT